jgi:hypothetical protein
VTPRQNQNWPSPCQQSLPSHITTDETRTWTWWRTWSPWHSSISCGSENIHPQPKPEQNVLSHYKEVTSAYGRMEYCYCTLPDSLPSSRQTVQQFALPTPRMAPSVRLSTMKLSEDPSVQLTHLLVEWQISSPAPTCALWTLSTMRLDTYLLYWTATLALWYSGVQLTTAS